MSGRDFKPGILFAVRWLHERAASMNDDKAKAILNSAAFHLGQERARGDCEILPPGYRLLGPDELDPVTIERCAGVADGEPECPGTPPDYVVQAMEGVGAIENARAACRTTKKSIAATIRALAEREG